jgi:hypothetical protein
LRAADSTADESFQSIHADGSVAVPYLRERGRGERLPPLAEVALAASALAELRHGSRSVGIDTLKRLLRHS